MEDQQPEPDDVTNTITGESRSGTAETTMEVIDEGERRRGRWWARVGGWPGAVEVVAAALFVGSVIFAGAALQPYLTDRVEAASRLDVARTAAAAVTTLWTYTPDTIDTLADRTGDYLTSDFGSQYRKFVESVVLPNRRAQITTNTEVVGVAVESLNGPHAVALVFTNTTATSPLSQNVPSLKYVAYRLEMTRQGSRWQVNNMATVSFIDLTPQL